MVNDKFETAKAEKLAAEMVESFREVVAQEDYSDDAFTALDYFKTNYRSGWSMNSVASAIYDEAVRLAIVQLFN